MEQIIKDGHLNFAVSPVFIKNYECKKRLVINRGGARSGKTYAILQRLIIYAFQNTGKIIDIVRKTHRELNDSVLKDFVDILISLSIYDDRYHHKTRNEFWINGNLFRFMGMDKAQKKRGAKRDILYINEANGISLEDWIQLTIRTAEQIYVDYNPSEYFWIDEHIIEKWTKDKFEIIHSTYKDNYDFLEAAQIADIENLINIDDYYYNVYAKGVLTEMKGKIYNNYTLIDPNEYDAVDADEIYYGVDWGYEHAMVLMELKYAQEKVFERELYCESKKFDDDLFDFMLAKDISMSADVYADPAYPASIRKGKEKGFSFRKAKKDIQPGIRFVQGLKRHICKSSVNHIRQSNRYKWKQTPDGKIVVGEPVKIDDDTQDATRYGHYTHLRQYQP